MGHFTLGLLVIILGCGLGAIVVTDAAAVRETKTGNGTTSHAEIADRVDGKISEEKRELWGAASRKPEEKRREIPEDGASGESGIADVEAAAQGLAPGLTVIFTRRHPCTSRLAGDHSCTNGGFLGLWSPMHMKKLIDFRPSRVIRDFNDINPFESVPAPQLSAADRPSDFVSAELPKHWRPVPDFVYTTRLDFDGSPTSPANVTAKPQVFVPVTASIDGITSASDDNIDASVEICLGTCDLLMSGSGMTGLAYFMKWNLR